MAHTSSRDVPFSFLKAVAALLAGFMLAHDASASSGGYLSATMRDGGGGCQTCHGAQDPNIAVSIQGPLSLTAGSTGSYTIRAVKASLGAGTNMSFSVAAEDAYSGTAILKDDPANPARTNEHAVQREITHNTGGGLYQTGSDGAATYVFLYTMPSGAAASSGHKLYPTARLGGGWNHGSDFTVYVPPTAPSSASNSGVGSASANISWSGGGTHYRVVYKAGAVAPSSPTGDTFVTVTSGTSTTISGLNPGTQYTVAVYSKIAGVDVFSTTAPTTTFTTTGNQPTTTTVTSSANPSLVGATVTFTAAVTASMGTPTGSVTFKDGSTVICNAVALSSGQAQCATSALAAGTHAITGEYSGGTGYNASNSSILSQVVRVSVPRYVNAASGANSGDCSVQGSPCKTITYAMSQATGGSAPDSISVAPGTYSVALGEVFPISFKSGIQMTSTGGANATVIDAAGAPANNGIFIVNGGVGGKIEGFTLTNGLHIANSFALAQGGAIRMFSVNGTFTISRNVFQGNEARGTMPGSGLALGGAIYASFSTGIQVVNNVFRNNVARGGNGVPGGPISPDHDGGDGEGGAVYFDSVTGSITNNTFYANSAIGGNGGQSSTVQGNGGRGRGGGVKGNPTLTLVNNIFASNQANSGTGGTPDTSMAGAGMSGDGSSTSNLSFGNLENGVASGGDYLGVNTVAGNPAFYNPPDLQIYSTSAAKGAGTASGAPSIDFLGRTRANPPSIGAFEAADPMITYNMVLEGWQQVAPYVATSAGGAGTATFNQHTKVLTLNLPYSGITGSETGAHIHGPAARGANAGVLVALSGANPKTDSVQLDSTGEAQLLAGQFYVNIHSTAYPGGEIRAQIDNVGATVLRALTVTKPGTGSGTVTGTTEAGTVINCGSDCSENIPNGKVATLNAAASAGSTFTGWGGACSGTGTCMVTMDAAKNVTASFDPPGTGSSAELALTQTVSPNPASSAKDIVYTLVVVNNGPATATNVTLTQPVPAGTSFIWNTPNCSQASGTVTCSLGSLAAGAGVRARIVVRPPAAGSVTNLATVAASQPDPNSTNNTASATVTVNASPAGVAVLRYRLYSDISKEHHFTTDLNEYDTLGTMGWVKEGTVGKVLNNPGSFGGVAAVPYYRLYDNQTLWHHWTSDPNEYYILSEFPWWSAEGVDGYILPTQGTGSIPLFRLLYPFIGGLHHWTIDAYEYQVLTTQYGWVGEGGSGYVIP